MQSSIPISALKDVIQMPDTEKIVSRTYEYLKKCPDIKISDKAKMMIEYVALKLIQKIQIDKPTTEIALDFTDSLLIELHNEFFSDNLSEDEKTLFDYIYDQIEKTSYVDLFHLIYKNRIREIKIDDYGIEENTNYMSDYCKRCKHTAKILQPLFSRYQAFRKATVFSNDNEIPLEATTLIKRLVKNYETEDGILSWMLRPKVGHTSIARKHVNLFDAVNFLPVIQHVIKETTKSEIHAKEINKSIFNFIMDKFTNHMNEVLHEVFESNISDQKRERLILITQEYIMDYFNELVSEQERISYIPLQLINDDNNLN